MKRFTLLFVTLMTRMATPAARNPVPPPMSSPIHQDHDDKVQSDAGYFNVKNTAKVAAYVVGAQGIYASVAPAKVNKRLGLSSNPLDDLFMARCGALLFLVAILIRELVLQGSDISKAIGKGAVPVAIVVLQSLLNGKVSKSGLRPDVQYALVLFLSLVAYTNLTGSVYANIFVNAAAALAMSIGVTFYPLPGFFLNLFSSRRVQAISTATKFQLRAYAIVHLVAGIIVVQWLPANNNNVNAITSVGYGWIPFVMFIVDGLSLSKDFVKLGMNQGTLMFWLAFHLIVAGALVR